MRRLVLLVVAVVVLGALMGAIERARAQVPITVYGHVYMPDGSPAAGASVKVTAGGVSKSTKTDSSGKYKVDLTVSSVPVTVKVTAKKGEYQGSASRSGVEGAVKIDVKLKKAGTTPPPTAPRKKKTTLTIWVSKREYIVGDQVSVGGSIEPAMSVNVTIVVVKPDAAEMKAKVRTKEDGTFSYAFTVNTVGVWKVYATFAGTDEYAASTSDTIELYVKQPSSLEMDVKATDPKHIVISGVVSPPAANATVMIYVSLDGGKTWLYLCNATTDEEGRFKVEVSMAVSGELLFKAVFPGTETLAYTETEKPPMFKLASEEEQKLRQQVESLTRELEAARARIGELERELGEAKARAEELGKSLEEALSKAEGLEKELAEARGKVARLSSEVALYRNLTLTLPPLALAVGVAVGYLVAKRFLVARQA